ncbi:hypothetical protein GVN20_28260 [Runella sp. CRIBMP]|uniref:hypothetical protein n=1 Tax=Runella sp. CRIBMP TaxID=2683261 RepID=UPI001412B4C4|nr:hypothetical protein [Runella sp. CRIBMP]NBB23278.1 hypothetical protein [Runella sp. CRIBMP]
MNNFNKNLDLCLEYLNEVHQEITPVYQKKNPSKNDCYEMVRDCYKQFFVLMGGDETRSEWWPHFIQFIKFLSSKRGKETEINFFYYLRTVDFIMFEQTLSRHFEETT